MEGSEIDWTDEERARRPIREYLDALDGGKPGRMLGWLRHQNIEPHIPVWDKAKRADGTLSREDFTFDRDRNLYVCPRGQTLKTTGKVHDGKTLLYRASKHDCDTCPLKLTCCPNTPSRKVPRDINEEARDYARALMKTERYRSRRASARRSRPCLVT